MRSIIVAALFLPAHMDAVARPCSRVPAGYAFDQADLVVIAREIRRIAPEMIEGDSKSVLRIEKVIKGNYAGNEITVAHFLCASEYSRAFRPGYPLIAFIDSKESILVHRTAVLPAADFKRAGHAAPKDALRDELLADLQDPDPRVVKSAIGALVELDGPKAVPVLGQFKKNSDFGVRIRALSWLSRFGDADAFHALVAMTSTAPFVPSHLSSWNGDTEEPLMTAYDDAYKAIEGLGPTSFDGSTEPKKGRKRFIKDMITLASRKGDQIRAAAIYALRRFNDAETFPTLAAALDDPNIDIRYGAMATLCIAMNASDLPCPGFGLFRSDEKKYIDRCRLWEASRRSPGR